MKAIPYLVMAAIVVSCLTELSLSRSAAWQDPVTLWRDVVAKSPGKARPHYNLGRVYRSAGQDAEALKEYEAAVMLDPSDPVTHYNIGNSYLLAGHLEDAIREYEIALALRPDYPDARQNLSTAHRVKADLSRETPGRRDGAAEAAARLNQGNLHFLRGELDKAAAEYGLAVGLMPGLAEAHYNLGKVYRLQGRNDEALEEYKIASELKPDDPETRYNMGNIHFGRGRLDDAVREYRAALKLKPDYPDARHNLAVAEKARNERK